MKIQFGRRSPAEEGIGENPVEEKVIGLTAVDMTDRKAIDEAYRNAVSRSVDYLLEQEWEVRERKASFRIYPVGCPDSAGSIAEVKIREGHKDFNRKVAETIAMLPGLLLRLNDAEACIEELIAEFQSGLLPEKTLDYLINTAGEPYDGDEGGAAV